MVSRTFPESASLHGISPLKSLTPKLFPRNPGRSGSFDSVGADAKNIGGTIFGGSVLSDEGSVGFNGSANILRQYSRPLLNGRSGYVSNYTKISFLGQLDQFLLFLPSLSPRDYSAGLQRG